MDHELVIVLVDKQLHHVEFVNEEGFEWKVDSHVLGINPKFLYKLYYRSRGRLEELYLQQSHNAQVNSALGGQDDNRPLSESDIDEFYYLTLLALLATTENMRAVNARKRLLLGTRNNKLGRWNPRTELLLLNVLLSSPLPKHNKSPILWHHRKWLISNFGSELEELEYPQVNQTLDHNKPLSTSQKELKIVFIAAELHPRNYYAWSYARWLVHQRPIDSAWVIDATYTLCRSHVSDISMWAFLIHFLYMYDRKNDAKQLHDKALALARLCPNHESLNYFIKWTDTERLNDPTLEQQHIQHKNK